MEILNVLHILASVCMVYPTVSGNKEVYEYEDRFLIQFIDHFNYLGQTHPNGMYKQRYFDNK